MYVSSRFLSSAHSFDLYSQWKLLSRRGTRGEPPSRSMEVILLPKRSSGPHGVRLGVDEIALSCMLLVLSRRGEDATLPSTMPTSTYGPALHRQAARPRGGLLSKYGDSYKSTTKRESIGPSHYSGGPCSREIPARSSIPPSMAAGMPPSGPRST